MYEVGIWFVHLMNVAILAIIGLIVLVAIFAKKRQYQRQAAKGIQAEILLSTGWPEYHTVKCGVNDEWVRIGGYEYKLNPTKQRWGLHPRVPFMGLRDLQVPIRRETWYKDNPNPVYGDKGTPDVTASEVEAKTREAMAVAAGAEAVEMEARQTRMVDAIANQPNKNYVYMGLVGILIGIIVLVVRSLIGG